MFPVLQYNSFSAAGKRTKALFAFKKRKPRLFKRGFINCKVRAGIEPANMSFADSRLTTWPPHRIRQNDWNKIIIAKKEVFRKKR